MSGAADIGARLHAIAAMLSEAETCVTRVRANGCEASVQMHVENGGVRVEITLLSPGSNGATCAETKQAADQDIKIKDASALRCALFPFIPPSRAVPSDAVKAEMPTVTPGMPRIQTPAREPDLPQPALPQSASAPKGRWTPEEDEIAVHLRAKGESLTAIGLRLDRSPVSCRDRLKKNFMRRRVDDLRARFAEDQAAAAEFAPVVTDQALDMTQLWARHIDANLNALGYVNGWTPQSDLELVEALARGTSTYDAARGLQRDISDVIARFKALLPAPTIESQTRTLKVLRWRAQAKV